LPLKFPLSFQKREKKKDGKPMKIIYYSQTGTAEDFSKRLGEEAETYGFSPDVIDAENFPQVRLIFPSLDFAREI